MANFVAIADALLSLGQRGDYKQIASDMASQMITDRNATAVLLTAILHKLDIVGLALANDALQQQGRRIKLQCEATKTEWVKPREEKHGPIPKALLPWLDNAISLNLGVRVRWQGMANLARMAPTLQDPPSDGTPEREIYNRWMKRKAKPTTQVEKNGT